MTSLVLADFVDRADVRMVQARYRPGFMQEAREARRAVGQEEFENHFATERLIDSTIHDAAAAFAQLIADAVVRDRVSRHDALIVLSVTVNSVLISVGCAAEHKCTFVCATIHAGAARRCQNQTARARKESDGANG